MLAISIDIIFKAGRQAASADNSQPWHFSWDGEKITITYAHKRVADTTFPVDHLATLLGIGSVIENMDQAAKAINVTIDWTLADDKYVDAYAHGLVKNLNSSQTENPELAPLALYARHTNRLKYRQDKIADDARQVLQACGNELVKIRLYDDKTMIHKIGALVSECSEVRFQTQEVHEWLGHSFRFTKQEVEKGDGLDVNTIDLPPGGSLCLKLIKDWRAMSALNKLGAYKILSFIDADPINKSSSVVAIVSSYKKSDCIEAGRLMTRVWIDLNNAGVAVQPYFVMTDQISRLKEGKVPEHLVAKIQKVKERSDNLFGLGKDEQLIMLLRIGYPKKAKVVRAHRIAMEQLCSDLSISR